MKKQLLTALVAFSSLTMANAQTVISDTVEIGAGYANQVWYSMSADEKGTSAKDAWDIAFDLLEINSSIQVNTAAGAMLWCYPNGDATAWSSVDTTGLSTWTPRYNSDTSWALGAIGNYADPANPFDLDWGTYDMSTHTVVGDSIFIIQLTDGNFKKLFIEKLLSGKFTFKYADLDGSNEVNADVKKTEYQSALAYYSMVNDQKLTTHAPDYTQWDLLFTQYTGFVPIAYNLTGVLHNRGVRVAQIDNEPNAKTYSNWQAHYGTSEINTIGYDWKTFNGSSYDIRDSQAFFVYARNNDVWRLVFTGFESTNGSYMFEKELLAASIAETATGNKTTLSLYPNPANGSDVRVVYNIDRNAAQASVEVYDMSGRVVYNSTLENTAGLHHHKVSTAGLQSGIYVVSLNVDGTRNTQRLVIN